MGRQPTSCVQRHFVNGIVQCKSVNMNAEIGGHFPSHERAVAAPGLLMFRTGKVDGHARRPGGVRRWWAEGAHRSVVEDLRVEEGRARAAIDQGNVRGSVVGQMAWRYEVASGHEGRRMVVPLAATAVAPFAVNLALDALAIRSVADEGCR